MTTRNTAPSTGHSDIVESEVLVFLQTIIDAGCGLSGIRQPHDEAQSMSDIRARFIQWQTSQHTGKQENGANSSTS